ncbi:hypothetical protein [Pseudaquabacterium pictum]|uniref:Lipocalin-like domain-containing protein n=1 Tax=Pseudaquabacterium pictum TaxID=2315236 RepID=A0A480AVP5_9BURK|nr:hypothetical protein [Rubrivivax pictus]GCL64252.1 hypothetical protein AQPW35_33330 [Rubrivivax pictus]
MKLHAFAAAVAAISLTLAGAASAQVTVPNTFVAGAPARAADVNANFQALATAINSLAARVAKTEGQLVAADLAGSYTLSRFQTEMGTGTNSGWVASYVSGGTLTLAANGSATLSGMTESGSQVDFPSGTRRALNRTDAPASFSWSLSGGKVVLPDGGSLSVADGGRLLISTSANTADGTTVLLLFVRSN